jgi:hypothetical protein
MAQRRGSVKKPRNPIAVAMRLRSAGNTEMRDRRQRRPKDIRSRKWEEQ